MNASPVAWARKLFLVALPIILALASPRETRADEGTSEAVRLTGQLLAKGLSLVRLPLVEVNLSLTGNVYLPPLFGGSPGGDIVNYQKGAEDAARQLKEVADRIEREGNSDLRRQLEVMREHLDLVRKSNELLAEQGRHLRAVEAQQVRMFEYQKQKDESLLRKLTYTLPPDKLIVIVADFSSGNPDEGREVADEIAHQLSALKKNAGIDVHILAGEIKPGVIIRSEEMARDVGRDFPPGTDFVVIWGTMSPRTVGKYRPHITCVHKTEDARGLSATAELELESQALPFPKDAEPYRRECYERLVAVTCAAVPQCYAAHLIRREVSPDLSKFYAFVGADSEPVRRFRGSLDTLAQWPRVRGARKFAFLHGLSVISTDRPYPQLISNDRDGSLMVLITDRDGKARRFRSPEGEVIVYADMLETTNRQFVKFLGAKGGNREEGGTRWINLEESFTDIKEGDLPKFLVADEARALDASVFNVSWFGARAYCEWAGKQLPIQEEWQAAAAPRVGKDYPWGDAFDASCCNSGLVEDADKRFRKKGGAFEMDRSAVGCLDMAGNLAEWCDDYFDEKQAKRKVCGGSFLDTDAGAFKVTAVRGQPQTSPARWIGFRGVIRIPVEK
jgi:hypothetical protein